MLTVEIFTDGACRGNPGLGGWGAYICYPNSEKALYGAESSTTNNRMELLAPIMALDSLESTCQIVLVTDSQYVKKGMTEWLVNWKRKNWLTANKKPVKNSDLWKLLDEKAAKHRINWQWIRGHNGHFYNEKADQLANQAMDEWLFNQSMSR